MNERLYVSGLIDDYDRAVERKDREKIISILKEVELEEESIHDILIHLGVCHVSEGNKPQYGYD